MNPIAAISYPPVQPDVAVETQWQPPAPEYEAMQYATPDVQRFHQALAFHATQAPELNEKLMQGIAALDAQGNKLHQEMLHLDEGASTAAMMKMQSAQIQTFVVYEGAARAISLTTQGITELMRMQ